MFTVLTVASEFGAGGGAIARRLAEMLGWKLLDGALIDAVARTAQVDRETVERYDQRVDSWWQRFHRGGVRAAAIAAGMAPADTRMLDTEMVAGLARRVIGAAAAGGSCVIVGRGAQCVLRGFPEAFHVFVYGGWRERVRRVRAGVAPVSNIGDLIRDTDRERASYIRTYCGFDWMTPHLYHMMINSDIGIENAAGRIADAVERGCTV